MPSQTHARVAAVNNGDPFSSAPLGDLTARQYRDLCRAADLSPGYFFLVRRYREHKRRGSSATHVSLFREDPFRGHPAEVGLISRETAQYYDSSPDTQRAALRVAHHVYRVSVQF